MKSYAYVIIDTSLDQDGLARDKLYVGKSNDPYQRFEDHIRAALSGIDTVFYRAIRAHGQHHFVIRDIHECASEEAAFEKEKQLINELRTYIGFEKSCGYNSTLGGDGFDSETSSRNMIHVWERDRNIRVAANKKRWSQEEKDKQSKRMNSILNSIEGKEARTNRMKNRWQNPDYREHMSSRQAALWRDPEFHRSVASKIKAAKDNPEERDRLARRNSEKWKSLSDEERQSILDKMRLARQEKNLAKKHLKTQTQTRAEKKMGPTSARAKETWADPDVKARRIQAMKDAWADPAKREKRIQAMIRKTDDDSKLNDG